ncbi:kinase-like protein [Neolentinus lepideus HHB14362 ss-1]|uniref:Kinase-like protein n=1 Tax=Neolentinus lepideus HHB14362 ss-1 TaxID=1314782 RepID=A0A165VUW6_9AGAM|nr:kinase-like protein [Neolentinus lepideus HHB14362 ss-1]
MSPLPVLSFSEHYFAPLGPDWPPVMAEGAVFFATHRGDLYIADSGTKMVKVIRETVKRQDKWFSKKFVGLAFCLSLYPHDNISQILFVSSMSSGITAISQPFYSDGNVRKYIAAHPHVDKLSLLHDAASGLAYAHEFGLTHGNIKPENFLVDDKGHVRVSDFQVDVILRRHEDHTTGRIAIPSSWMYKPKEELQPLEPDHLPLQASKAGDVASFGYTPYEVLAGRSPFTVTRRGMLRRLRSTNQKEVIRRMTNGSDEMWDLLTSCWNSRPQDRPTMAGVRERLQEIRLRQ